MQSVVNLHEGDVGFMWGAQGVRKKSKNTCSVEDPQRNSTILGGLHAGHPAPVNHI